MSLDPSWLEALGGDIGAVAMAAMGFVIVTLWRRNNHLHDARIADMKEHSAQKIEIIRTLDKAIQYIEKKNG